MASFHISCLSTKNLLSILNKMTASSLVNLRQTCHAFDQFVMEHRSHLRIPYSPPVNICIRSISSIQMKRFDQTFAGLAIQNVVCNGTCNQYKEGSEEYEEYLKLLRRQSWQCQRMVVSQVREAIVAIIQPDILVIEDYSREDEIPKIIKNLELLHFTGNLPDFEQYTTLHKVWIQPATIVDFINTIEAILKLLSEEKFGFLDYLEIIKSHSKKSLSCKNSLQEAVNLIEDTFGIGSAVRKPTCRMSEVTFSKIITAAEKFRKIEVSNEVTTNCVIRVIVTTF